MGSTSKSASARLVRAPGPDARYHPDWAQARGWLEWVEITVEIKRSPEHQQIARWRADGHTLHYRIGGGVRPGIFGFKEQGKRLCNIPLDGDGSQILPIAAKLGLKGRNSACEKPVAGKAALKLAQEIHKQLTGVFDQDQKANKLRRPRSMDNMHPRCVAMMKKLEAEVKQLRQQVDCLPAEEHLKLKKALLGMNYCLQCYKDRSMCKFTRRAVAAAGAELEQ
jgi:hypothetical protein